MYGDDTCSDANLLLVYGAGACSDATDCFLSACLSKLVQGLSDSLTIGSIAEAERQPTAVKYNVSSSTACPAQVISQVPEDFPLQLVQPR